MNARTALEQFYLEHAATVRAICSRTLHDRGEAEDAAQQVFLSAFRALERGTVPRDPGAWLATIARHECWARARAARPAGVPEELPDATDREPPARVIERAELTSIWQAMHTLPEAQRTALLLREVGGLSYDELADDLNVSLPSVRSLLLRARQTVRARLQQGAAAFGGASWFEALARLFAGGPNPAVSSATRAAAIGLGVVALTGGAAAVPTLEHERRQQPAVQAVVREQAVVPVVRPAQVPSVPRSRPVRTAPARAARVAAPRHDRRRGGDGARGRDRDTGDGDSAGTGSGTSGGGPSTATVSDSSGDGGSGGTSGDSGSTSGGPGPAGSTTVVAATSSSDGPGGGSDGGGSDGGGSGGSDGGSGDGGSGSGHDGSGSDGGSGG